MSLRFFCDQCVPAEIGRTLCVAGHDVLNLREALPVRTPVPQVIAKALELDRVLISLNGDFSDIVAYPPGKFSGVIAIQLHNHPEIIPQLMKQLVAFLATHPAQEYKSITTPNCSSWKFIAFEFEAEINRGGFAE
jgi:predicted nuclease of predicted toxin-antitoxin system